MMTLILIMIMILHDINTERALEQRSWGQPHVHRKPCEQGAPGAPCGAELRARGQRPPADFSTPGISTSSDARAHCYAPQVRYPGLVEASPSPPAHVQ